MLHNIRHCTLLYIQPPRSKGNVSGWQETLSWRDLGNEQMADVWDLDFNVSTTRDVLSLDLSTRPLTWKIGLLEIHPTVICKQEKLPIMCPSHHELDENYHYSSIMNHIFNWLIHDNTMPPQLCAWLEREDNCFLYMEMISFIWQAYTKW
jgi:hypothetical protein